MTLDECLEEGEELNIMNLDEYRNFELKERLPKSAIMKVLGEAIDRIEEYEKALNNSPFDIGICPRCDRPIIVLPDGLPRMCSYCKQNGAKYHAGGE